MPTQPGLPITTHLPDRACQAPAYWGHGICGKSLAGMRADAQCCSGACRKRRSRHSGPAADRERIRRLHGRIDHHETAETHHRGLAAELRAELAKLEGGTAADDPAYRSVHRHPRNCACTDCMAPEA